jgi:hypothetical protein
MGKVGFAERNFMECRGWPRGSFRLRAGEFDDLALFFRFFNHELAERGGRN